MCLSLAHILLSASLCHFFFVNVCNNILSKNVVMRDGPQVHEAAGDADLDLAPI